MFKFLGSLALIFALTVPSFATGHCNQRIVERVIANDYDYNAQAIVLVPHQNFVVERVVQKNYDFQPVVVEKVIERQVIKQHPVQNIVEKIVQTPVRIVERVQERPRLRVKQRIVQKNVVIEKVQVLNNRNVVRQRIVNEY